MLGLYTNGNNEYVLKMDRTNGYSVSSTNSKFNVGESLSLDKKDFKIKVDLSLLKKRSSILAILKTSLQSNDEDVLFDVFKKDFVDIRLNIINNRFLSNNNDDIIRINSISYMRREVQKTDRDDMIILMTVDSVERLVMMTKKNYLQLKEIMFDDSKIY